MKEKTILISGVSGFIGSHLAKKLISTGYYVIGIDNMSTGRDENIADIVDSDKFYFIKADIRDKHSAYGDVHAVFNLASPASPKYYSEHPIDTLEVGSIGVRNMLDIARNSKAIFIQASTSEVYGDPAINPQVEGYWGNVNPIGPRSMYDEAKRFGEAITTAYGNMGVRVRLPRIFNSYGPGMSKDDGRVIPNFINQAIHNKPITVYGDGSQTRSFCYVSDLVDGLVKLMSVNYKGPINIGNPNEITLIDLANMVKNMCDSKSKIVFKPLPKDDPKVRRPDIRLANKKLSWFPRVKLYEGLTRTIEYFKNYDR